MLTPTTSGQARRRSAMADCPPYRLPPGLDETETALLMVLTEGGMRLWRGSSPALPVIDTGCLPAGKLHALRAVTKRHQSGLARLSCHQAHQISQGEAREAELVRMHPSQCRDYPEPEAQAEPSDISDGEAQR